KSVFFVNNAFAIEKFDLLTNRTAWVSNIPDSLSIIEIKTAPDYISILLKTKYLDKNSSDYIYILDRKTGLVFRKIKLPTFSRAQIIFLNNTHIYYLENNFFSPLKIIKAQL